VIGGGAADGDITLTGDTFDLAALTVQTAGGITVRPRTDSTPIGLAGGAGILDLSTAELAFFNAGEELVFGRSTGTGLMAISTYANWAAIAGEGVRFVSDTGVVSINGAQTLGARNLTIESNADAVVGAAVTGSGILTLMPASPGATMGVAGGAGALNFSSADVTSLGASWSSYVFGRADQTGALTSAARTWPAPVTWRSGAGGSITITGLQDAGVGSATTFTFSGPANIDAALDLTNATGGTQAITFHGVADIGAAVDSAAGDLTFADDVTLTGTGSIDTGSADILFSGTLDGAFDLELTTTGDITFAGDVGGATPLGDVIVDPRHLTAGGSFDAASFTLLGGTGNVSFAAGTGLNVTGDIAIDTNGNITGTYTGVNGVLEAGTGTITATTSFATLDISGAAATLSAGYIGTPGTANQAMANRIKIGGAGHPFLPGDPAYRFAGFIIGAFPPGGGGDRPPEPTPPVVTPPVPPVPPVILPSTPGNASDEQNARNADIARIENMVPGMDGEHTRAKPGKEATHGMLVTYTEDLLENLGCEDRSRNASCSSYEQ
jgi:hypothetical protein